MSATDSKPRPLGVNKTDTKSLKMIKELIYDIAFDKIKLSQALTRAKLIANKVKNDLFKKWLDKEIQGYSFADSYLPKYRKVYTSIQLIVDFPNGQFHKYSIKVSDENDPVVNDFLTYHSIVEPISMVEAEIENDKNPEGYIHLPSALVDMLAEADRKKVRPQNGLINRGHREISRISYQNVIELTKQKLIETLTELDDEFPNLINEYKMTDENNEKVQNIVTNHIYGNYNPLNIAAGHHVEQKDIQNIFTTEDISKLENLGVDKKEVENLKEIIATSSKDKATLKDKSMKWLGSVLASIAARGLYDNIPVITDIIHKLI